MKKTCHSINFLEQSKFILSQDDSNLDMCPLMIHCSYCVVYNYKKKDNGCSIEEKINAAKYYLRNEKLKRISK